MPLQVYNGSVCEAVALTLTNKIIESSNVWTVHTKKKHFWTKGRKEKARFLYFHITKFRVLLFAAYLNTSQAN